MTNKIKKMTDEEVMVFVSNLKNDAEDFIGAKLATNWQQAQKYYFGEPTGNEVDGKSKVISRDVSDAIEWMIPSLMEIFCGGKPAVLFEPQTQEDVDLCEQASDYCNYIFYRKNNGFSIMYDWFKDSLLYKCGIVKTYWEETEEVVTELYGNLDESDLQALLMDTDTELIERTDVEDGSITVKITKVTKKEQIKIEGIPIEDFLIDRYAKSTNDATFLGHRRIISKSDFRSLGFDESLVEQVSWGSNSYSSNDGVKIVREEFSGNSTEGNTINGGEANDKTTIIEAYVRLDCDGDGIAELRRIVFSDNNILLSNDDWDVQPFSSITPNPIQHSFFGQSVYDMVHDIQDIKTTLLRNQLDNMYMTNKGRFVIVEGQVNMQDLNNNVQGGIIREKMANAVRPLVQPPLPQGAYDMLGYMDELITNRCGVSARSKGLDDKILNSHTGQGQVNKVMSVAEQRLKLVARNFAETGVRDLFLAIYQLSMKYQQKEEMFRLDGKFVRVNPSKWKDRTDMQVIVGMGTNDKDQQLMHLSKILEVQKGIVQSGGLGILTNQSKIYNTLKELSDNSGYKNSEKFWLDPTSQEAVKAIEDHKKAASKPSPDEIKANASAQKTQSDMQLDHVRLQQESNDSKADMELRKSELAIKERELALKERNAGLEEDKQDLERAKFEWEKQVNISEVVLEEKDKRPVAIGDGKF